MPKTTVGATAVSLTGGVAAGAKYGTQLKAAAANSGKVYVGYSNAVTAGGTDATDGMELSAGEAFFVPARLAGDAKNVWVIGSASGQVVYYQTIN